MPKPFDYVIELNEEEAKRLLEDWFGKKPNPERDALITRARKLNIDVIR